MSKRSLLADITGVLGSHVLAMFSVLGLNILLSRTLGPSGYGIYTSLFAVPLVVLGLVQLGMSRSAVYHLGHQRFDDSRTVSSIFVLLVFTGTTGVMASAIAYVVISNPHFSLQWIILLLCGLPLFLGNIYTGGIFIGKEQIRTANRLFWMPVTMNLALAMVLVGYFGLGITGALISMLTASALVFGISIRKISAQFRLQPVFDREIMKSLASKGFVYSLAFVMLQLNYKADILLLQKMVVPSEVGLYALGVSVTEQLWLLPYAMGVVLMSRTANAGDKALMARTTAMLLRTCVPAALLGAIALMLLTPLLLPLIFGDKFIPSIRIVQTILPGIVIFMIFRIIESYFAGLGKPRISVYVLIPALCVNIALNLWWIPVYGTIGAAWATNISYALATAIYTVVFMRYSKFGPGELFILKKDDLRKIANKQAG